MQIFQNNMYVYVCEICYSTSDLFQIVKDLFQIVKEISNIS